MGNGVGMLMQLLQQDQAARQRAAFFDAQQQEAQAERSAAAQQHNTSLSQQLRAQMLMHAMDDQARQSTDEVNYNRQVAADSAHWARVKEQEAQRNARDDAKWKAYLDAIKPKTESAERVAEINARGRIDAAKVPRVSRHYGYSVNERRGGTTGGGQQDDFRKTPLGVLYAGARSIYEKQIAAAAMMPTNQQAAATESAKKQYAARVAEIDKMRAGGGAPAPVVDTTPPLLRAPAQDDTFR